VSLRVLRTLQNSCNRKSSGISKEISDVLVSLQFQDRVSQILSHVRKNMDSLNSAPAAKQGRQGEFFWAIQKNQCARMAGGDGVDLCHTGAKI